MKKREDRHYSTAHFVICMVLAYSGKVHGISNGVS